MKKLTAMALMAALILGFAGTASALHLLDKPPVEGATGVKTGLEIYGGVATILYFENYDFADQAGAQGEQNFEGETDYYLGFDVIRSENLHGRIQVYDEVIWGQNDGYGTDTGSGDRLLVEEAWLEFNLPDFAGEATNVSVKAGDFGIKLPGVGVNVLDDTSHSLAVTVPFNEMIAATAGFSRLAAENNAGKNESYLDAWWLSLPVAGDGYTFNPYVLLATGNTDANTAALTTDPSLDGNFGYDFDQETDVSAMWYGAQLGLDMLDPFFFNLGFVYGDAEIEDIQSAGGEFDLERSGYIFEASADYKMELFTPSLYFVYGSGTDKDDLDDGEINILPSIEGGNYKPFNAIDDFQDEFAGGLWSVAFMLKDLPCPIPAASECMEHQLILAYIEGTNDKDALDNQGVAGVTSLDEVMGGLPITEEDSMFTVEFNTTWTMYENLAANLFLAYTEADFDEDVHGEDYLEEDYTTAQFTLSYSF